MVLRGPRSAADLCAFRPDVALNDDNLIDIDTYAAVNGGFKETLRRLKRAERSGKVIRHGALWYWVRRPT